MIRKLFGACLVAAPFHLATLADGYASPIIGAAPLNLRSAAKSEGNIHVATVRSSARHRVKFRPGKTLRDTIN